MKLEQIIQDLRTTLGDLEKKIPSLTETQIQEASKIVRHAENGIDDFLFSLEP